VPTSQAPASPADLAARFAALHRGPALFVLPNAWDVPSALLLEAAGFPAVATTSAGVAWALGYRDGETLPTSLLVDTVTRLASLLHVPLSVDLEAGYGRTPEEVAKVIRAVVGAGAVGVNIEDRDYSGKAVLREIALQVEVLRAAREAARAMGVPLFLNARTDIYLAAVGPEGDRRERTLERLQAYVAAGADGVFVPALREPADIEAVARGAGAPLNVLARPGVPPVPELTRLGAARLTIGSGAMLSAYGKLRRIAAELQGPGTYGTLAEDAIPYAELQGLLPGE
jgi:2-methylisocitrate lyase-like PEP mutase family enzyme